MTLVFIKDGISAPQEKGELLNERIRHSWPSSCEPARQDPFLYHTQKMNSTTMKDAIFFFLSNTIQILEENVGDYIYRKISLPRQAAPQL